MQKDYPVFIINFNWLTYLKNIIAEILRLGGIPVIIDNASTYPPLLKYYDEIKNDFLIYRNPKNVGPHGILYNFVVADFYKEKTKQDLPHPVAITDPDLDLSGIPDDGLMKLYEAYTNDTANKYVKYGFSIEYENILPNSPRNIQSIHEQRRLQNTTAKLRNIDGYISEIDTTFHLYAWKRTAGFRVIFSPAFRLKKPYTCKHLPYYWNQADLETEEISYYLKNLGNLNQLGYSKTFIN